MPRITIPRGMLGGMQPGMSRLASALAGGDQAYEQGYQGGAAAQSKIAQALAQVEAARSQQRLHDAQADEVTRKTRLLGGRPDLAEEQIAFSTGLDVPTVRGYRQAITTGRAPQVPMGPETEDGQTGLGTMPIDPAVRTKIGQALARVVPLLTNSGDLNPEQLAQAAGAYRQQDLADAIIAGTADRNKVGGAQAAVAGKPLFHADGSGAVLDQFSGGLDTSNPLAQSTIGLRGAQAGQARAAAADHYAGVGEKNARTAQVKQQTEQGAKGTLMQTDAGPVLVDPRTGQARPITGPDGVPLKPKGGSLNGEQANALTFANRMRGAEQVLQQAFEAGVTQPGFIKRAVTGTLGAVPIIGESLAGAGNVATNWTQSDMQQAVEQAKRDFINAVLRRESGAAISMGEFSNADQQYFPQPGDSKATIKQKAAARQRVIQGMLAAVPENMRQLPDLPGAAPAGRSVTVDY